MAGLITGNLLSYNNQGFETSVAGWTNNAAITSVTQVNTGTGLMNTVIEGTSYLQAVSDAVDGGTTCSIVLVSSVAVSAATSYICSLAYATGGTSGGCTIGLQWFNSTPALISTSTSSLYIPGSSQWGGMGFSATSPALTASVKILLTFQKVAFASTPFDIDEVFLGPYTSPKVGMAVIETAASPIRSTMTTASTR